MDRRSPRPDSHPDARPSCSRCGESADRAEQRMRDEQFATAFRDAARDYERGRPGYPPEAIDALVRELHLGQRSVVVDLAAAPAS
jgi:hypothetical protein